MSSKTRFFKNFGLTNYRFGDYESPVLFNNLTQYVDIIDQIKDQTSFYNKYTIVSGERPDTLSQELYGTTDYYWTFYLMNDQLRESGWPILDHELEAYAKKRWPNRVVTSEAPFATIFPVGQVVTGQTSGTTGKILKRNLDLGQLVIEADKNSAGVMNNFGDTEIIEYQEVDGSRITLRLVAETPQYLSVHHFEDSNGNFQDINPHVDSSPSGLTPITNLDRLEKRNEELKQIILLKPDAIVKVVGEFNKFMKE